MQLYTEQQILQNIRNNQLSTQLKYLKPFETIQNNKQN